MTSSTARRSRQLRHLFAGAVLFLIFCRPIQAQTPPVVRSTEYNGAYSNIVYYPASPWMNTSTVLLTVEAWVSCRDLLGVQAFVARHLQTNFYFGAANNKLRFYRSGGTFAESDGTLVANRWTHVAATYDGTTVRFYLNGAPAGTKGLANTGNNGTNSLSLGGQHDLLNAVDQLVGGYALNGYLDEVRVWSVVRSQSEIAANMYSELRAGAGLLATFGSGGGFNDIRPENGRTDGIPVATRRSGFGLLPRTLCIPFSPAPLQFDGYIDLLNEYRGAETIVLRSPSNGATRDYPGYLMASTNATNFHLYVGVPDLPSQTAPRIPHLQIAATVNPTNGSGPDLGDWVCTLAQDQFQGGSIYTPNPPFFPNPNWWSWGQGPLNWEATNRVPLEFNYNYEFRIHGRHLNHFTNSVGLLVRYFDFGGTNQLVAPLTGVTNLPSTYAPASWCGLANRALAPVNIAGAVSNITTHANESGWTVTLRSGLSPLSADLIRSFPVSADGTFTISGEVPSELPFHLILESRNRYTILSPEFPGTSGRLPAQIPASSILTYSPCGLFCPIRSVRFVVQSPPGPLSVVSVNPTRVVGPVVVRSNPRKVTPTTTMTIHGANLHNQVRVYFKGSACTAIPPTLCTSDFVEALVVGTTLDRTSLTVEVPELVDTSLFERIFTLVLDNPLYLETGGSRLTTGPTVLVMPPPYPQIYGFEFPNEDDEPSLKEFEAVYGDNIYARDPLFGFKLPGVIDPYYLMYSAVYLGWMHLAHGSCTGFSATSRLMANRTIPDNAFDRADNGGGVHGVLFPSGYVGLPPCDPALPFYPCPPKPAVWTGFDLFQPHQPINIWGRITSFQGVQTSAEFLNIFLGQFHRPIASGLRRGLSVGDPLAVLAQIRANPSDTLVILGGRDFQDLHTVVPYGIRDEQGLADDVRTPIARTGFSLITIYDNNWPDQERFIEIDRNQNLFRYFMFQNTRRGNVVSDGAGLYFMPLSVFRNPRHALGPVDIAANLTDLLRILHTGTASTTIRDSASGVAGWTPTNLINSYEGARPFLPPGALPNVEERFDRTQFFLPLTNPPVSDTFVSAGGDVLLHYALGEGDFAYGFRAPNTSASNSTYGILIGLNKSLEGVGVLAGAPVAHFSAAVSVRDTNRQSRVWLLDAGSGELTPNLHLERSGLRTLKIRNHAATPLTYRVNLSGIDAEHGPFEFSSDTMTQPGNSTAILQAQEFGSERGISRALDANNDGAIDLLENMPARGALRVSRDSGLLALRWRPISENDALLCSTNVANAGAPVTTPITTEGADRLARIPLANSHQFYRVQPAPTNCVSLAGQSLGTRANPWSIGGFTFRASDASGAFAANNTVLSRSGTTGLDVQHTMAITLEQARSTVELDLRQASGIVTVDALGSLGTVLASQTLTRPGTELQHVTLTTGRVQTHSIRVTSRNAPCLITDLCVH